MSKMIPSDFKQRVRDEKQELDIKRGKLENFLVSATFQALPRDEKLRLQRQQVAMETYSQILFERLEADFQ